LKTTKRFLHLKLPGRVDTELMETAWPRRFDQKCAGTRISPFVAASAAFLWDKPSPEASTGTTVPFAWLPGTSICGGRVTGRARAAR